MKVLITGGCGFIGSNLIRYLLGIDPDIKIGNMDALTYAANFSTLKDVESDKRYYFIKGDIRDPDAVDFAFTLDKPDLVLNLAAESHVDRSIKDSGAFVATNVVGTQVLLEATRKHRVDRFVQISTDEVYGSLNPDDPPFAEDHPIAPNSPYSASKASADLLVGAYVHTYGLDAVITRCSNNYGPYQFPEKFIPLFITNALEDREVPLYGQGLNVRDWIHVRDHCSGIWKAATRGQAGETYNFGSGEELANVLIATRLLEALGKPKSLIKNVEDRLGHDFRYGMDFSKAQRDLGWEPTVSFEDGLQETIEWYRDNPDWWKPLKARLNS